MLIPVREIGRSSLKSCSRTSVFQTSTMNNSSSIKSQVRFKANTSILSEAMQSMKPKTKKLSTNLRMKTKIWGILWLRWIASWIKFNKKNRSLWSWPSWNFNNLKPGWSWWRFNLGKNRSRSNLWLMSSRCLWSILKRIAQLSLISRRRISSSSWCR